MNDDILKKFAEANALAKSGGGGYRGSRSSNQWGAINDGENRVRLGGVFIINTQHFIEKLIQPQFMRSKQQGADNKGKFSKSMTCLCWNIDQEKHVSDEHKCCAICDLRQAARQAERNAKESGTLSAEDKEKLVKQFAAISGDAVPKTRYLWPAITRADTMITVEDENGNKNEVLGWKVLNLPMEANKGIENLLKQYPKLLDPDEGVDIIITKTKGTRTTYTVQFALNGTSIAMTPLTEEERAMEVLDMKQFVFNHPSPRQVFVALNESYQELITSVLNKGAEDYPEDAPIKRERTNSAPVTETKSEAADISSEYVEKQAPTPPIARAAAPKTVKDPQPPKPVAPQTPAKSTTPAKPTAPVKPPVVAPAKSVTPAKPMAPAKPTAPAAPAAAAAPAVNDVPTPACFGTCDRADPQCSECAVINECETKKNES